MQTYNLLQQIDSPADLRRLTVKQLPELCDELRHFIIEQLSSHPGHLASSLGTVELTVALHYVFSTPNDRLVWDVGHQAYGHKILTGRREQFHTNRQMGGLRPFPFPTESPYDTFACGHASNSISAALGMATAVGNSRKVVAVIGDGAMSGGLAYEGLNNVSETPNNLLIILNDNNMSIDPAVGGFKHYLQDLHTSSAYNGLRYRIAKALTDHGFLNDERRTRILRFNNSVKSFLLGQQNIFEGMNIRYFGPNDGHDVMQLVRTLQRIKDMKGPKLLHIRTVKGKGYSEAEKDPTTWHAPGLFNPDTGEVKKAQAKGVKFQQVFGHTLLELAQSNPDIVGITPAMPTGCSMNIMMKAMPERCFDVGIAEGHAVTFAAGLAREGKRPFCNIYSSFAQRAYDNIIHDTALQHLPVTLCLDRAGLVGEDGATHHGAFDLAALRPIPHITIAAPMDEAELRNLMFTAQSGNHGTFVIRYPRGGVPSDRRAPLSDWRTPMQAAPIGRGRCLRPAAEGCKVAVLSLGIMGWNIPEGPWAHYDMRFLKPLDDAIMEEVADRFTTVVTVEDGVRNGGLGSAVLEWLADHGHTPRVVRLGLPDEYVEHGSIRQLQTLTGLDPDSIESTLNELA